MTFRATKSMTIFFLPALSEEEVKTLREIVKSSPNTTDKLGGSNDDYI